MQAKYTISGGLRGWKSQAVHALPNTLAGWRWCWTFPTFLHFPSKLGKNKTKQEHKNIWCPCSPKCWTCLFEMICQQLFTSRPITFIGFGSLASVDRLIYSNSESHLYSLYQKVQPALYLNATLLRAGTLVSERVSAASQPRTDTRDSHRRMLFWWNNFCQRIRLKQEWLQLFLTVLVREDIWED